MVSASAKGNKRSAKKKAGLRTPDESFSKDAYEAHRARKSIRPTKTKPPASGDGIHKGMLVVDIVALCPDAEKILAEYGLHCVGCSASPFETLESGCVSHGIQSEDIDELVEDLQTLMNEMPAAPSTLTVTASAARALTEVATKEGRAGDGLLVTLDGRGGFCMEFRTDPVTGDQTFWNREVPDMRVFASSLTLKRIGGATIDFRDGRFKLDLADKPDSCNCEKEACACKAAS